MANLLTGENMRPPKNKLTKKKLWVKLSQSLGCGGCQEITTVTSPYTCLTCGRMLCGKCGDYCIAHKQKG